MPSDTSTEPSPLFDARMAGALWLVVILVSIGAVLGGASLDMRGDPETLAANVLASASKIRLTFLLFFLGKICYLGVTVLLYIDQRIRREALDLDLARAAGLRDYGSPAPGTTPGS